MDKIISLAQHFNLESGVPSRFTAKFVFSLDDGDSTTENLEVLSSEMQDPASLDEAVGLLKDKAALVKRNWRDGREKVVRFPEKFVEVDLGL